MSYKAQLSLVSLALLIRWLVAQWPHSGQSTPPMFGDYEAQRHWMEVTVNLPVKDWYSNTTDNDLSYWGLDYPPLTAYHMFLLGKCSQLHFNSSWVELHNSRGFESYEHKLFMRATVIITELLIYMPPVIYYFYKTQPTQQYQSPPSNVHKHNIAFYTALTLLYPAQILIDHGHFQYNCFFLGLTLWAVIFMIKGRDKLSAFTFTLALNYKQMSLYYSLPFFWFIAAKNLRVRPIWKGFAEIITVGLIVMTTIVLLYSPWLTDLSSIIQVSRRIFPFYRGVFEDKVANFWFNLNLFYKYKHLYTMDQLVKASTIATLVASLPAGIHLMFKPNIRTFKYALVNTSMVFFLFSFQVHEKTILVPSLPILLLVREHPMATNWFVILSTFSLQPLLIRDGQTIPYFALITIYTLMTMETFRNHLVLTIPKIFTRQNLIVVTYLSSIVGCFVFSLGAILIKAPANLPHIHPTINALYSCSHFFAFLLFYYYRQFVPESKRQSQVDRIYLIKKTK